MNRFMLFISLFYLFGLALLPSSAYSRTLERYDEGYTVAEYFDFIGISFKAYPNRYYDCYDIGEYFDDTNCEASIELFKKYFPTISNPRFHFKSDKELLSHIPNSIGKYKLEYALHSGGYLRYYSIVYSKSFSYLHPDDTYTKQKHYWVFRFKSNNVNESILFRNKNGYPTVKISSVLHAPYTDLANGTYSYRDFYFDSFEIENLKTGIKKPYEPDKDKDKKGCGRGLIDTIECKANKIEDKNDKNAKKRIKQIKESGNELTKSLNKLSTDTTNGISTNNQAIKSSIDANNVVSKDIINDIKNSTAHGTANNPPDEFLTPYDKTFETVINEFKAKVASSDISEKLRNYLVFNFSVDTCPQYSAKIWIFGSITLNMWCHSDFQIIWKVITIGMMTVCSMFAFKVGFL